MEGGYIKQLRAGRCKFPRAAALVGALSAISAAIPAVMGHSERVNRFEKLHFSYCELFELTKRTIAEIRRSGLISEEQIGAAKLLGDLCSRFGKMDDPDHKDKIRDDCERIVRERFPVTSLWYASEDVNAGQTTIPTS